MTVNNHQYAYVICAAGFTLLTNSFDGDPPIRLVSNCLPSGMSFLISLHCLIHGNSSSLKGGINESPAAFMHKSTMTFLLVYHDISFYICLFPFCSSLWKICTVRHYPLSHTIRNSPIQYIHIPATISDLRIISLSLHERDVNQCYTVQVHLNIRSLCLFNLSYTEYIL
jgi:hypothetical protein